MPPKSTRQPPPPRPRLTHFLALTSSHLPTHPTFPLSLQRFRDLATAQTSNDTPFSLPFSPSPFPSSSGFPTSTTTTTTTRIPIPPRAIRPIGTMHLTLGVMALQDAEMAMEELRWWWDGYSRTVGGGGGNGVGGGGGWVKGGLKVRLEGLRTFDHHSGGGKRRRGRGGGVAVEGRDVYERCKVLWVKPVDCDIAMLTTTTIPTPSEGVRIVTATRGDYGMSGDGNGNGNGSEKEKEEEEIPGRLLQLATSLRQYFYEKGLLVLSERELPPALKKSMENPQGGVTMDGESEGNQDPDDDIGDNDGGVSLNPDPPTATTIPSTNTSSPLTSAPLLVLPPPTLHLTVLNSVYAKARGKPRWGGQRGGKRGGKGGRGRGEGEDWGEDGYDVRELVEEFKDHVWAEEIVFDRIEVMKMGEVKVKKGGSSDARGTRGYREEEDGDDEFVDAYYESVGYIEI